MIRRFKTSHMWRVKNLVPVIGDRAALSAVRGDEFAALTVVHALLLFSPFCIWAEFGGPTWSWIVAALGMVFALTAFAWSVILGLRSAREAALFVTAQTGQAVRLHPHGRRAAQWQREIRLMLTGKSGSELRE
jgi:hypothetical protein